MWPAAQSPHAKRGGWGLHIDFGECLCIHYYAVFGSFGGVRLGLLEDFEYLAYPACSHGCSA